MATDDKLGKTARANNRLQQISDGLRETAPGLHQASRIAVRGVLDFAIARQRLRRFAAREWSNGEPELQLTPALCRKDRGAVDIGANRGIFSFFMVQNAASVTSIEPNPQFARFIRRALPRASVIQAAASDHDGEATLSVPIDQRLLAFATIDVAHTEYDPQSYHHGPAGARSLRVQRLTLDSLGISRVAFIKIDVEGHELAVLHGAEKTIARERPAILVEAEERHRHGAVSSVRDFLSTLGYHGYFLLEGRLAGIDEFSLLIHQDRRGLAGEVPYINNFLFLNKDDDVTLERCRDRARQVARTGAPTA